jgi:PAS domain S-box-containing protein
LLIRSVLARVAITVALPALALLASEMLRRWLAPSFDPLFIAASAATTWLCGVGYGSASLVLSALILNYFFLPPIASLALENSAAQLKFFLFLAASGFVIGLIHYARHAKERLAESEQRYRSLAELIPFGGWMADHRGNMIRLSESFLKNFGVTMEECRGLGWIRLIEENERSQVVADWRECMRSGYFWDYEYRMRAPGGQTYVVLSRGIPVTGASGKSRKWIGFHLDLTERERSAEQRLAQARDIARFNAELEQFAYVSAHDLQEPLRMIASYLQLLSRRYKGKLDSDADTFIDYAVEGAGRLQSLLQDLLLLQQVGKGNRQEVSAPLNAAVNRACKNLSARIEELNARITCDDLPSVSYDERAMAELFIHLLDNSLKYRRDDAAPEIHISAAPASQPGMWEICVKDNGIGIPPQFHEKIFDIFQRLHPRSRYHGTGIGLAICKKIVAVHGGQIYVQSNPSEGSTFCFTLPVTRGHGA